MLPPTEKFIDSICSFLDIKKCDFETYLWDLREKGWIRWGGGTVETSTAEILYVVARAINPVVCLEAGTNWGHSTAHIAAALEDNWGNTQRFYTVDNDLEAIKKTQEIFFQKGLKANFLHGDSVEEFKKVLEKEKWVDLVFIDSSHAYEHTKSEFEAIRGNLQPKSLLMFHDSITREYGVRKFLEELLEEGEWKLLNLDVNPVSGLGILKHV